MQPQDFEHLLTPAARQMLVELQSVHREMILRGAAELAVRSTGSIREISVADLANSFARIHDMPRPKRSSLINRALVLYSIAGIMIMVLGTIFVFLSDPETGVVFGSAPMIVAVTGIVITLTSSYLLSIQESKIKRKALRAFSEGRLQNSPNAKETAIGAFLLLWAELEIKVTALASVLLGESSANAPFSRVLSELRQANTLPGPLIPELIELLDLRNRLAHTPDSVLPADVLEGIATAERIYDQNFRPLQPTN